MPASAPDLRLILASGSPRRRELLEQLGIEFTVRPADLDESVRAGERADDYVQRLAKEKAAAGVSAPGELVLAADTSVVVDDRILGKPAHEAESRAMIDALAGRSHRVLTGVALAGAATASRVISTEVRFRRSSAAERDWYVATGEGKDKAGGYAIQGKGAVFIAEVNGSSTNVIGLPLSETIEMLAQAGFRLPWSAR